MQAFSCSFVFFVKLTRTKQTTYLFVEPDASGVVVSELDIFLQYRRTQTGYKCTCQSRVGSKVNEFGLLDSHTSMSV